ncbi:MAG TPA: 2-C-methyl-D-erythritol 4-phosphate cytidylyltransferase [Chloroflexota bacterium]
MNARYADRGAVIVAAGRGTRMGADKVWLPLGPMPVLAYSLLAFSQHASRLALVVSSERVSDGRQLVQELGIRATVCPGGERRQDSVLNGLRAIGEVGLVAIHDGARPLVGARIIEECYTAAWRDGAAIAAVPVRDTLKRESGAQRIGETVSRDGLWAAQTPQTFRRELILRAYEALEGDVTDDASAVERLGMPVVLVPGDPYNFKLTTREDLEAARALVKRPAFRAEL